MAGNEGLDNFTEIYVDLLNLGYRGLVKNMEEFCFAFSRGPPNQWFLDIAAWLSIQLTNHLRLQNRIIIDSYGNLKPYSVGFHTFKKHLEVTHPFFKPLANPLAFFVQLSVLLEILGCRIKEIMSGNISQQLLILEHQIFTIEYLIQELRAAKIVSYLSPKVDKPFEIQLEESNTAKNLKDLLIALNFSRPPNDIQANVLFREISKRVCSLSQPLLPDEKVGEILFSGVLTKRQWFSLEKLYAEFFEEYKNRREMDITRVFVTISSFLWKDSIKKMSQNITSIYNTFRANVSENPAVEISDMIAATADMNIGGRVSSSAVCKNTHSAVKKVQIGDVPDRGGRPNETAPPPPDLPSWQPRSDTRARGHPPFPTSSGRHVVPDRRSYTQVGTDPSNNFSRPVQMVAQIPVAGDNFARFGNIGQHALHSTPILMNPGMQVAPANIQFPPPHGLSVPPPGYGQFIGQGSRGGLPAFRCQRAHGGPNDFGDPSVPVASNVFRNQGARFQRGLGGRGGRGSNVTYGGGRGNARGFGHQSGN